MNAAIFSLYWVNFKLHKILSVAVLYLSCWQGIIVVGHFSLGISIIANQVQYLTILIFVRVYCFDEVLAVGTAVVVTPVGSLTQGSLDARALT